MINKTSFLVPRGSPLGATGGPSRRHRADLPVLPGLRLRCSAVQCSAVQLAPRGGVLGTTKEVLGRPRIYFFIGFPRILGISIGFVLGFDLDFDLDLDLTGFGFDLDLDLIWI